MRGRNGSCSSDDAVPLRKRRRAGSLNLREGVAVVRLDLLLFTHLERFKQ